MRGARGGRDVAREAMPGVPREQCEGHGFLGFGGYTEVVGGLDAAVERCEIGGEHAHEGLIARAATGNDVVDVMCGKVWSKKQTPCERDAAGGECGCSGEDVVRRKATLPCECEKALDKGRAVLFAAGALWWTETIVGIAQQSGQDGFTWSASGCESPIAIVGFVEETLGESIDDHIGGAGVEGD